VTRGSPARGAANGHANDPAHGFASGLPTVADRLAELRAGAPPPVPPPRRAAPADATSPTAGDGTGPGRGWRRLGGCLVLGLLAALVTGPSGNADRPLDGARGALLGARGTLALAVALLAWAGLTCWPRLRGPARLLAARLVERAADGPAGAQNGWWSRRRRPRHRRRRPPGGGYLLALAVAVAAPLLVSTTARQAMVNDVALYGLLAVGLSIAAGRAGVLDLGYAGYCAVGAYAAAYLCAPGAMPWRAPVTIPSLLALPAAMAVTAVLGLVLGAPLLRRRADPLVVAVLLLSFGGLVQLLANGAAGVTGGAGGVFGVPRPSVRIAGARYAFGLDPLPYYYLLLGLTVLLVAGLAGWDRSRGGLACAAARADEAAAEALGVRAARTRVLALAAGAAVSGLVGAVFATKQFFNPQTFSPQASMLVLTVLVAGGLGSRLGAVVGAAVLQGLAFALRDHVAAGDRFLYFGALVMVLMAWRPARLLPAGIGGPARPRPGS